MSYQLKVREHYGKALRHFRGSGMQITKIDASLSPEEITEILMNIITNEKKDSK